MKTIALVIASLIAFSGAVHAADATAPVKEIMDATRSNWADNSGDWSDIFDASRLTRLYSKDFVAKYQAAAQFPAVDDDGISPFDYDVIVNGQDACPLEDLTMAAAPAVNGTAEVTVRFKKSACSEAPDAKDYTTVRFEVIEEGGTSVIDDVVTENIETQGRDSLKATMALIAKGQ
ncbi:hypothetical protein RLEG12_21185 [Rhizobium leguminosarum bv. trifolii CB782]|uniref:Uncharacterized protein n=2 Tax=Rhizobium hidalgonense TaxID=1538159 RepID=A0ABX4K0J0_9HYPH|nr:hypothetical protein [Rhizobium hidalgonense]AHG45593.1 hypothetical protein RLEG12_21185 [Rhizobium leguminosarum bv. trifolii CB782]EJC73422.1 hypothetical protein Rleg10DRAFT_1878 [Rhizobium leguminosarum bv. trifolii WSM2012]MDR9803609.1 hypothetical protein [Rhizobium hidalgonense]MDR9809102.1 hypothetical protein [Rhizobium hidalgonense]PDT25344.1 hypothetical protein CO674_00500 [Rhizobium hidalgonense]